MKKANGKIVTVNTIQTSKKRETTKRSDRKGERAKNTEKVADIYG